jgi:aspartate-semialdehyde dehydrogenase
MRVAVVGATGIVGRELLRLFEKHRFPVKTLRPFSSGRRRASVRFRGRTYPAPAPSAAELLAADLVFLVSDDAVAERWGPMLEKAGVWTIDESAAFRMRKNVPLVIPEVNGSAITSKTRLIASPNCTVTGLAIAAHALYRSAGAKSIRVASYQAVSGAGRDALLEFLTQIRACAKKTPKGIPLPKLPALTFGAFPEPIGFNILPHIGRFNNKGETGEESKVRAELQKLWGAPKLPVSATTVRVPVLRGHSLAVWMETKKHISPARAAAILKKAPGVKVWGGDKYPTVYKTANTEPTHVGRIRESGAAKNELCFWVLSDNLLKGASLNALNIAEHLIKKKLLRV